MPLNETQSLAQKQTEQSVPMNRELANELRETAKNQQAKFFGLSREEFLKQDFINLTSLDKARFATDKPDQHSLHFDKLFVRDKGDDTTGQRPLYIITEEGKEPHQRNIQIYTDENEAQKVYALAKDNYRSIADELYYVGISGQEIHIRKNIGELTQANERGEVPKYDQIFQITNQQKQQIESLTEPDITRAIKLLLSKESPQIYPELTFPEKMDQAKKLNFLEQAKNNILDSFTGQNIKLSNGASIKEASQKDSLRPWNGLDKIIPISGHDIKQVDPILGGILDGLQKGLKDLTIIPAIEKSKDLKENRIPQSINGQSFTPDEYRALVTYKEMNGLVQVNGKAHIVSVSSDQKLVTKPLDEFKIPSKIERIALTPEQKDTLAKGKVVELQDSQSSKVFNVKLSASQASGIAEVSGMIGYHQKKSNEELIKSPDFLNQNNHEDAKRAINAKDNLLANTPSGDKVTNLEVKNGLDQYLTNDQHLTLERFKELPGFVTMAGKEHIVSATSDNQITSKSIEDFKLPFKINGTLLTEEQKKDLAKGEIIEFQKLDSEKKPTDTLWLKLSSASPSGVAEVNNLHQHLKGLETISSKLESVKFQDTVSNLSDTTASKIPESNNIQNNTITARDIYNALTTEQASTLLQTKELPGLVTVKDKELIVSVGKDDEIISKPEKDFDIKPGFIDPNDPLINISQREVDLLKQGKVIEYPMFNQSGNLIDLEYLKLSAESPSGIVVLHDYQVQGFEKTMIVNASQSIPYIVQNPDIRQTLAQESEPSIIDQQVSISQTTREQPRPVLVPQGPDLASSINPSANSIAPLEIAVNPTLTTNIRSTGVQESDEKASVIQVPTQDYLSGDDMNFLRRFKELPIILKNSDSALGNNKEPRIISIDPDPKKGSVIDKPLKDFNIPTAINGVKLNEIQRGELAKGQILSLTDKEGNAMAIKLSAATPTGVADITHLLPHLEKYQSAKQEQENKVSQPIQSNEIAKDHSRIRLRH